MAAVTETTFMLQNQLKQFFDTPNALKPDFELKCETETQEKPRFDREEEAEEKPLVSLLFPKLYGPEAVALVHRVLKGLENHEPEMAEDGEGGTYFLRDADGENIAVFKPADEEPFSVGNPKQALREPMKKESGSADVKQGIQPGEGAYREVAAYLLDHQNFARVPMTIFVEFNYPLFNWKEKQGSLQAFVPHHYESWDIGPGKYTVSDVHRIGVLDLRLLNVDRHGGNILVKRLDIVDKGCYELIPIDHGFSLPDSVNGTDLWFEWLTWPQSKSPFDQETLRYIANISVPQDAATLRELGIREDCVRTMMISTMLLKRGAAKGLNLFQIANMLCRSKSHKQKAPSKPSAIEVLATQLPNTKSRYFLSWLETEMDKVIEKTYPQVVKKEARTQQLKHRILERGANVDQSSPSLLQSPISSKGPRKELMTSPRISTSVNSIRLGVSASQTNLAPSPSIRSKTHMRSNSSILDMDQPGLGFGSSFGPLRRNYSHEALATLG